MLPSQDVIARLNLGPHPEGGWFRETWRAPTQDGSRSASTAILFLLSANERSHWHKVDADEIWIWQAGDPLALHMAADDEAQPTTLTLGGDLRSQELQGVVPAGRWQAAEPQPGAHGYSLVSCIVAPGFDFSGFTLAPADWQPGA
ncbi:MAG: cupin domain-containing protein [Novosphingobium sp.]